MEEDNLTRQVDEIEALAAIFEDDWHTEDELNRIYNVRVTNSSDHPELAISMQITLPEQYPSSAPPVYEVNAPWLRGRSRKQLDAELQDIWLENIGESILYQWIEKAREFIESCSDQTSGKSADCSVDVESELELCNEIVAASVINNNEAHANEAVVKCPEIFHGDAITDRRSTFQPHLARITHKNQVDVVIRTLCENKKIANATHNMLAYRVLADIDGQQIQQQGCDDDGETHAGSRMLHLLQIVDAQNVVVVVSRWYGGIQLGPDRFKHINNCTRAILQQHNFIVEKDDKKSGKGDKKAHKDGKRNR